MTSPDAQDAALLAQDTHRGQKLPDGKDYITHLEAVASIAENLLLEETSRIQLDAEKLKDILHKTDLLRQTCFLHDAMEDHPKKISPEILRKKGYNQEVIAALKLLCHKKETPYEDYIVALKPNWLARYTKRADTCHNSKATRLGHKLKKEGDLQKTLARVQKYLLTHLYLSDHLDEKTYRSEMTKLRQSGKIP